ncbi:MAG: hypothetical protein AB7J13_10565 [Pyrinomonadaceae bacterium]
MRIHTILFSLCLIAISGLAVSAQFGSSAQCDPSRESPIRCGYYTEGYQDGENDARSNRSQDHRRYRSKFERQYESFYRNGYTAGYDSVRPGRWTNSQRSAYDSGYAIGQNDRRRGGQERSAESVGTGYDSNISLYFRQGYNDGFANRSRRYDFPVDSTPGFPPNPGGGVNGTATWSGRVDIKADLVIRGNQMRVVDYGGSGTTTTSQNIYGSLPRRATNVNAVRRDGRGGVTVVQQPTRLNDFTAVVQINDPGSGSDNYRVDISWAGSFPANEPYRPGSVTWSGRIDHTVNIMIEGSDVWAEEIRTSGPTGVTHNINGYLAHRAGNVRVRKLSGRGTVKVLEQPSLANGFMAIVQVFDPGSGADNYRLEISW